MSRLKMVPGGSLDDVLAAAPGALEADSEMRRQIRAGLTPRMYAMIGVTVAGLLRSQRYADALRGPLDGNLAAQLIKDWTQAPLDDQERAVLAYVEKGTLDEASVRRSDVDRLRDEGLSDRDVLSIATAIAYHNYAIRMAAAFDVNPQ